MKHNGGNVDYSQSMSGKLLILADKTEDSRITLPFVLFHALVYKLQFMLCRMIILRFAQRTSSLRTSAARFCSSSSASALSRTLVPHSSLTADNMGPSILHLRENGAETTPTDTMRKGIKIAKALSLSSSALGVVMIPALTSYMWSAAAERPSIMLFAVVANSFLGFLSLTPFLLQFLVKRYVLNIHYNRDTKVFTTVHLNFFMQKKCLQFKAEDVVDAATAPETNKLWFPLATAFVYGRPLLFPLDKSNYRDVLGFQDLTKNIQIPTNHD
uniref:Transmembrane protein n=1 Tax=Steinernema glaseri TaxID=37863 RepID=A0A1I8A3C9_9BILA